MREMIVDHVGQRVRFFRPFAFEPTEVVEVDGIAVHREVLWRCDACPPEPPCAHVQAVLATSRLLGNIVMQTVREGDAE